MLISEISFIFTALCNTIVFKTMYNQRGNVENYLCFSVAVIPFGETRRIQTFPVFIVTMIFSLFSYIWLLIILVFVSPRRVEVWEAGATLGFIPVIIITSYMAEKGWFDVIFCQGTNKVKDMENGDIPSGQGFFEGGKVTKENMADFIKEMKKTGLTDEEASQMAAAKIADSKPKSRMYYKIGASREMAGGKKVDPTANMSDKLKVDTKFLFVELYFYSTHFCQYHAMQYNHSFLHHLEHDGECEQWETIVCWD